MQPHKKQKQIAEEPTDGNGGDPFAIDEALIRHMETTPPFRNPGRHPILEELRRFCAWLRNTQRRPLAGRFFRVEGAREELNAYAQEQRTSELNGLFFAITQIAEAAQARTRDPNAAFDMDEALISEFEKEASVSLVYPRYAQRLARTLRRFSAWRAARGGRAVAGRFDELDDDCEVFRKTPGNDVIKTALTHLRTFGEGRSIRPAKDRSAREAPSQLADYKLFKVTRTALQHLINEQMDVLYKFSQWLHQRSRAGIAGRVHDKTLDTDAAEYARRNPKIARALRSLRRVTPRSVQAEPPAAGAGAPPVRASVLPQRPPFSFREPQSSARADSHAMSGPPEARIPHTEAPRDFDLNLAPIELAESAAPSFSGQGSQPAISAPDLTAWFPMGFDHSDRTVPDYMINPLARSGSQPGGLQPPHVYIHGRPYVLDWQPARRESTPTNPTGASVGLHPAGLEFPRLPSMWIPGWLSPSEEASSSRPSGAGFRRYARGVAFSSSAGAGPSSRPSASGHTDQEGRPASAVGRGADLPDFGDVVGAVWCHSDWDDGNQDVPGHLETALRERGRWPTEHGAQFTMFCINGEIYTAERRKRQDQGLFASQPSYGVYLNHHPPGD